jgi:hypothetical protein
MFLRVKEIIIMTLCAEIQKKTEKGTINGNSFKDTKNGFACDFSDVSSFAAVAVLYLEALVLTMSIS